MNDRAKVLDPDDAERVVERYRRRIAEHGVTFESLCSGTKKRQRARHEVHHSALRGERPSILDIGCGLASFYQYLKGVGQECSYRGYDLVSEYIEECRNLHPEAFFERRNIFQEGIGGDYDTIVMSQVLNNRYLKSDNMAIMKTVLALAYRHTHISVSVDMMSTYVDYQDPELFYYSPEEIFRIAKSISRRVTLRHDFRPYEFCVQLYHERAEGYTP